MTADELLAIARKHFDEREWWTTSQLADKAGQPPGDRIYTLLSRGAVRRTPVQRWDPLWSRNTQWRYQIV